MPPKKRRAFIESDEEEEKRQSERLQKLHTADTKRERQTRERNNQRKTKQLNREMSEEREVRQESDAQRHQLERQRETSEERLRRRRSDVQRHRRMRTQPGWLSSDQGLNIEKHKLGPLNSVCEYCGALHFGSSKQKCCKNGRIYHEPPRKLPQNIEKLLLANGKRYDQFREKITIYNNLCALASINYNHVDVPQGIPITKVQGIVMHNYSHAAPRDGKPPKYGQVYALSVFDLNISLDQTEELLLQGQDSNEVDVEIIEIIQREMMEKNPLVMQYQSVGEIQREFQTKHPGEKIPKKYIFIKDAYKDVKGFLEAGDYKSQYERIKKDQAAFLYETDPEGRPNGPGIWVKFKVGRKNPRTLPYFHPLIDPLCYVLIDFYGNPGYDYKSEEMKYKVPIKRFGTSLNQPSLFVERGDPNLENSDQDSVDSMSTANPLIATRSVHVSEESSEESSDEGQSVEASDDENKLNMTGQRRRSCILSSSEEEEIEIERQHANEELSTEMRLEFERMFANTLPDANMADASDSSDDEDSSENEPELSANTQSRRQEKKTAIPRAKQSMAEFYNYKMQMRSVDQQNKYHPIFSTKKLGQLFTCDTYMRVVEQRHDFARKKRVEKRVTTEGELEETAEILRNERRHRFRNSRQFIYRNRKAQRAGCELGAQIFSAPEVTGSASYYRRKMEDAMCIVNYFGKPDLFCTFTGNPQWPEIQENLLPHQKWTDAPMLVVKVFHEKMVEFLEDVIVKAGFGKVRAYAWSVEFQKRGMPHLHLLLTLEEESKFSTTERIDKYIWARIPERPENSTKKEEEYYNELKQLVLRHQIHTPCSGKTHAYCRKMSKNPKSVKCTKHFPHELNDYTKLGERGYAEPWRPRDVKERQENGTEVDNSWVVSYCPTLTMKYRTHINVEVCTNVLACKYIYKYIYKGVDKLLIQFVDAMEVDCGTEKGAVPELRKVENVLLPSVLNPNETQLKGMQEKAERILRELKIRKTINGRPTVLYDELAVEEQLTCVTAPEGTYGIAEYPRTRLSHSVASLEVHKPQEKSIVFNTDKDALDVEECLLKGDYVSTLEAWFHLNQVDPTARNLTYPEAAKSFILSKRGHKWTFGKRRQQRIDQTLVRVRGVNPRYLETYAIRELAIHTAGATSFEDLRKVTQRDAESGQESTITFLKFCEAAQARHLMNGEKEWSETMAEVILYESPANIRRVFASILIYGSPQKELPIQLWQRYWEEMSDWRGALSNTQKDHQRAKSLFHVQNILVHHNLALKDFGLPEVDMNALHIDQISDEVRREVLDNVGCSFNQASSKVEHEILSVQLNDDQKRIHDEITESVLKAKSTKLFAVLGSAGTGKTFLYRAIFHKIQMEGKKVAMIAHTGIASQLLIDGSTVHRFFGIDTGEDGKLKSRIHANTERAKDIRGLDCIVWDEISMSDVKLITAVDECLKFITGSKKPFGGKVMIVGGDYKQLLPIIPTVYGPDVVNETLLNHELWKFFKKYTLTENIRAKEDVQFSTVLEEIGRGYHCKDGRYPICTSCFPVFVQNEDEVIHWAYGQRQVEDVEKIKGTCILTTLNNEAMQINEKVLGMLNGEEKNYVSVDLPDENRGLQMPPEYFHSELDTNMPPHDLKLKLGCVVILLKNIDVRKGLCNGTRMIISAMHENYVVCQFLDKEKETSITITRMRLRPNLKIGKPMYTRTQLPLRLAYSMTVHKAQGQTLNKMGLVLRNPPFAHGHLYTALSRVRHSNDIRIYTKDEISTTDEEHQNAHEGHSHVVLMKNIVYSNVFDLLRE